MNLPFITHSIRKEPNKIHFNNSAPLIIEPYISVNNANAMISLIQKGLGFGMIRETDVDEKLKKNLLVEFLPHERIEAPIYIQYEKRRFTYENQSIYRFLH